MPEFPIHGSPYFDVREWVCPRVFKSRSINAVDLIDPAIIRIFDLLREKAGVITVNNWYMGGKYKASGFRAIWDRTGGDLSQHRCGRAGDAKSRIYKPKALLEIIMDNRIEFQGAGLTTIEDIKYTPTWLHLDCRPVKIEGGNFKIVIP